MTSYRKLRKAYCRIFGYNVSIKLYDKSHKLFKKASKKATAMQMALSLRTNNKESLIRYNQK